MNTDKFSLKRMWAVTTHYCVANGRKLLTTSFVIFAMTFLMSLLLTKMTGNEIGLEGEVRAAMLGFTYLFIGGLVTTILGSLTFSSYSTKPKRISAMMLPAKKSEKFLALTLVYVVFGNIILFASLILSDFITAAIFNMPCAVSFINSGIFYNDPELARFIPLFCLGMLWYVLMPQSIYVIGSAMWPKMSFLKTFIALSVFQFVFTIVIPFSNAPDWIEAFAEFVRNNFHTPQDAYNAICWLLVGAYVILIGMYALAWLRFRSLAVAKRFLS